MAKKKDLLPSDPAAERNLQLYIRAQTARRSWEVLARKDIDFWLGNHWTQTDSNALAAKGQSDPVIDRVYPSIENLKSILTARPIRFSVKGRETSDTKMSITWEMILDYIWDISEGNVQLKDAIHDYAAAGGLGVMWAELDKNADYGSGEVKFSRIDPFRVFVPPDTHHRFWDDAPWILVSTILTAEQVAMVNPEIAHLNQETGEITGLEKINGTSERDYPRSQQRNTNEVTTPDLAQDLDQNQQKYQRIDRYYPIAVKFWRVLDTQSGLETVFSEEEFEAFSKEFAAEIKAGKFDRAEITQKRIFHVATLGQIKLFTETLNTDVYPVVPIPNIWTGTPYTISDISKIKDSQILLNRLFSIILQHAQASAGLKLLLPEGSADLEEIEQRWADPNAVIEYNPEFGEPHTANPSPLANEFFGLIQQIASGIDLSIGIPQILAGQGQDVQSTKGETEVLSENALGRPRSKIQDIESAMARLGQVLLNFAKAHYQPGKILAIVQANNDRQGIESGFYEQDNKIPTIEEIASDTKITQKDVSVLPGSSLPNDKWATYKLYSDAYDRRLITRDTTLRKNPEFFEAREEIQKFGEIALRDNQIAQLEEQVKSLGGDLQTAQRESVQDKKRVQVSKAETKLNKIVEEFRSIAKTTTGKQKLALDTAIAQVELIGQSLKADNNG